MSGKPITHASVCNCPECQIAKDLKRDYVAGLTFSGVGTTVVPLHATGTTTLTIPMDSITIPTDTIQLQPTSVPVPSPAPPVAKPIFGISRGTKTVETMTLAISSDVFEYALHLLSAFC